MKLFLYFFLFFSFFKSFSQNFQWALQEHYSGQNRSESVHNDYVGNVYTSARFLPSYSNGADPIGAVFSKYSETGVRLWTDTVLNIGAVRSVVDSGGNMYAAGTFTGSVTFANNIYWDNGYIGGFMVKYNSSGQIMWSKNIYGFGIAISQNKFIYVGSTDGGGEDDFAPGGSVSKYTTAGLFLWDAPVSYKSDKTHAGYCRVTSLSTDQNDNVYATGQFRDTVVFHGTGSNSTTLIYNGAFNNNFIAKYSSTGILQWAKIVANPSYGFESQFPFSITSDPFGNSVIAGTFFNNLTIGSTTYSSGLNASVLIAEYDASGNLSWQKAIMGQPDIYAYAIARDTAQNFYITGNFSGNTNFGNGVSASIPTPTAHLLTAYVLKLDKNANNKWVSYSSQTGNASAMGYGVSSFSNAIYMVGGLTGTASAFGNTQLSSSQYYDLFVCRISNTILSNPVGLFEEHKRDFNVYPNPAARYVQVEGINEEAEIELCNSLGECIYKRANMEISNRSALTLDLTGYPPGIYFINVKINNQYKSEKIILTD